MSTRKVKIGINGCGKVAHLHAAGIMKSKNAVLTAVYNEKAWFAQAEEFGKKYNAKAYHDIEQMIKEAGLEAVLICTPHPFHAQAVIAAANAGAHCQVEKPLAASLHDCDAMIEACKKNNVKLSVVSQRRFYEPVQRIKKAIEAGKIGKPVFGTINMLGWRDKNYYDSDAWRGTWEMEGGGVLVNQAPHQLDIVQWLMGPIDEV